MFTKEEIAKGLERAQTIYEGFSLDELDSDQLYEAIVQANQVATSVEGLNPSNMPRYF